MNLKYRTVQGLLDDIRKDLNQSHIYIIANEARITNDIRAVFNTLKELVNFGSYTEMDLRDSYCSAHFHKANLLIEKSDFASAKADHSIRIIDPSLIGIAGGLLGASLASSERTGYLNNALAELNKAQSYRDTQEVRYNKAICYIALSNRNKAREELDMCIQMDPSTDMAVNASKQLVKLGPAPKPPPPYKPPPPPDPEAVKKRQKNERLIISVMIGIALLGVLGFGGMVFIMIILAISPK
ncbi:MAG: hypothetical protein ABRQ39_30065 [Candidatus Eremiobacterota bacterium]